MLKWPRFFGSAVLALGLSAAAPASIAFARSEIPVMWHTTHLIGTPVFNDQHQQIGTITEVLVSPSGDKTEAVLSVGHFVGGNKLIAVPVSHLAMMHGNMMMHGATKAMIESYQAYGGGNG